MASIDDLPPPPTSPLMSNIDDLPPPPPSAATSPVTSATTGALNLGGVGPWVGAAGKTGMDAVTGVNGPLAGGSMHDLLDEFLAQHKQLKDDFVKAANANPKISKGANFVGGGAALGAMGPAAMTPAGLAATGAVTGAANSDDLSSVVPNMALGAGTSMAAGGAIKDAAPYVGKALAPVGKALGGMFQGAADSTGEAAADLAEKATGATAAQAQKFAPGTGRELLDRGIVTFGSSPGDIAAKANAAMDKSSEGISGALKQLSDEGVTVDRNTVLDYIRNKIRSLGGDESQTDVVRALKSKMSDIENTIATTTKSNPVTPPSVTSPSYSEINPNEFTPRRISGIPEPTDPQLAQMSAEGSATDAANLNAAKSSGFNPYEDLPKTVTQKSEIPIDQAEEIKRGFQGKANWNSPKSENDANAIVSSGYRQAVEDSAGEASPEIGEQFLADKKTYGLLSPVRDAAERRATQLNQNPIGGLLDMTTGLAGEAVGGHAGAAAGLVAKRTLMPRLASMGAVSGDNLSQILEATPSAFGKFAGVLSSAASRGSASLGATDYILQQTNQDYRDQRDKIFNPDDENIQAPILGTKPSQDSKRVPAGGGE